MNSVFLSDMKAYRDKCMLMMNIRVCQNEVPPKS